MLAKPRTMLPVAARASAAVLKNARVSSIRSFSSIVQESPLAVKVKHTAGFGQQAKTLCPAFAFNACLPSLQQFRGYADRTIVKVPPMGDSITEGSLKQWGKNVGDFVKQDEEVVAIETDKVDVSVNAPISGIIREHFAKEEETVPVGADLFAIEAAEAGEASASTPAKEEPKKAEPAAKTPSQPAPSAPAAKEAAPPKKVEKKLEQPESKPGVASPTGGSGPYDHRNEHRVKLTRMRNTIASRLKESQNTAASLTTFNEVDMTNLMEFRSKYKDLVLKEHGVKLGFMSAFTKAVCHALKAVPVINATIDGDSIVYRDYVDVSVAVATPKGLVTPIVRNCERMTMVGVEKEIANLGAKARENKITLEDLSGGTFTISNGGIYGSLYGTPIINMPQSAILGMHSIKERPIAVDGKVEIRPMMYLALTYDHRLIDGREAVTFLVKVKEAIEDPRRILLEV